MSGEIISNDEHAGFFNEELFSPVSPISHIVIVSGL
jgi:hypothetical protein